MIRLAPFLLLLTLGLQAASPAFPGKAFMWGGTTDEKINSGNWTNLTNAIYVSSASRWALGQKKGGELVAWGSDNNGDINDLPTGIRFTHSDAGWQNGIAANADVGVTEWADPQYGPTSLTDWTNLQPSIVRTSFVSRVASGDAHSMALVNGRVYVWGNRGNTTNYNSATHVDVKDIDSNWYTFIGLKANGTVFAYGATGGPEQGDMTPPAALTNGTKTVVQISCGQFYNGAVTSDGQGYVWGFAGATSPTPAITNIDQTTLTNLTMLAVGREHVAGLLSDGTVRVWGNNNYGQTNVPTAATNIVFITSSSYATYAIQRGSEIVIDQTAVDKFDILPAAYRDAVKTNRMIASYMGASHAKQFHYGLSLLAAEDSRYTYDVQYNPNSFGNTNAIRDLTGKYEGSWSDLCGADNYWRDADALVILSNTVALTETAVGYPISASIFGWSYHMVNTQYAIDTLGHAFADADALLYVDTLYDFNTNTVLNDTKFVYHTSGLDGASTSTDTAWNANYWNQIIRDAAAVNGGVLLDQELIESWDNANSARQVETDYVSRRVYRRNDDYAEGELPDTYTGDHGNDAISIRKAKAVWVLLARQAGWDGEEADTNTFFVSITGNDANAGSQGSPWRTIQHAADTLTAGQTVIVGDGDYNESVTTAVSGTSGSPITFRASNEHGAKLREFRVQDDQWIVIDGFQIARASSANAAHIYVDSGSHNLTVQNCLIGPGAYIITRSLAFSSTTNSVYITDGNFTTAGFVAGSPVFLGACGQSGSWYTNHDTARTVTSISADGRAMVVSGTITNDTRTNYWGFLYPANNNDGCSGILLELGAGISCPTNITILNNTFSNLAGACIRGNADTINVVGNTFRDIQAYYGLVANWRNGVVRSNLFLNNLNVLYYTPAEIAALEHPEGGNWFDYQIGHIHQGGESQQTYATNNIFDLNWVQNVENQLGFASYYSTTNSGLTIRSNVFVGVGAHMSVSRDGVDISRNTIVRGSYDVARSHMFGVGGTGGQIQTGLNIRSNAFVDVGDHAQPSNEGFFSIIDTTNPVIAGNFVSAPETMGWGTRTVATNSWFAKNGGDPVFRDIRNPLGADGLPFTADDGLRPLLSSPLTLYSIGALQPFTNTANVPAAHFSQITQTSWQDDTGTNYDSAWATNTPYGRTAPVRSYATPEALGAIPLAVTFSASNTVSGLSGKTNWQGVTTYGWTFGDGGSALTVRPEVTHTFLSTGQVSVVLWTTNSYGNTSSYTNVYRLLPKEGAMDIFHVATNGNDTTGDGSSGNPWLTLAKAMTLVSGGDYVAVHAGDYNEDLDINRNVAGSGSRITFVGYGATNGGFNIRHPYYTVEGFAIDGASVASGHPVYLYESADATYIRNCRFQSVDLGSRDNSMLYMVPPASVLPTLGQLDCKFIDNTMVSCRGFSIETHGANHEIAGNAIFDMHGEADFIRPFGSNHWIHANFDTRPKAEDGGHPDCFQVFGNYGSWAMNHIIENNTFIAGHTGDQTNWAICQFEMNDAGGYTNQLSMTNWVIRNNAFIGLGQYASVDIDGTKWHNNLFYRCYSNSVSGHVFAWGGSKGSAFGSELYNNAFVECGGNNSGSGWYQSGHEAWGTNVSLTANYNYVGGVSGAAKTTQPPDASDRWGSWSQEVNGVNGGAPAFVSAASHDFRLMTNSVLMNAGTTIAAFTVDAWGNARPDGAAWDIGPFEGTGEGSEPAPPSQPSSLSGKITFRGKGRM